MARTKQNVKSNNNPKTGTKRQPSDSSGTRLFQPNSSGRSSSEVSSAEADFVTKPIMQPSVSPSSDGSDSSPIPARKIPHKQVKTKKNIPPVTRQIIALQLGTHVLIPKFSFYQLVREYILNENEYRVTAAAVEALQESTEMYLIGLIEDAYLCTAHRDRVTLSVKDFELARRIRGVSDPGNG